jgi:anti-sigma regulatory factor (Ser/Thr protein kinase)
VVNDAISVEGPELPVGWTFASPPARFDASLAERQISLAANPTSAGAARRFVRSLLQSIDREEWLDAAEVAISEIVTNACVHAGTSIELRAVAHDDHLTVEVRDYDATIPSRPVLDLDAPCGRGMALVSAVTVDRGVRILGDDGKIIWFCVADARESALVT